MQPYKIKPPSAALVFLTGNCGTEKTQLLQQFINAASDKHVPCYGILAEQILVFDEIQGYRVRDIRTDESRVLSTRTDKAAKETRQLIADSYLFDESSLMMANKAFDNPPENGVAIIDELGPLELNQKTGLFPILKKVISKEIQRGVIVVRPHFRLLLRKTLPFLPSAELTVRHQIEIPLVLGVLLELFCDVST